MTPNFKLSRKDLWLLLMGLQEEGRRPVGVQLHTLIAFVSPRLRQGLRPLTHYALRSARVSHAGESDRPELPEDPRWASGHSPLAARALSKLLQWVFRRAISGESDARLAGRSVRPFPS